MQYHISTVICSPAGVPGTVTRRGIPVTRHVSKDFMRPLSRPREIRVSPRCAATEDPFNRLGVAPNSTKDAIRKAYRKLVLRVHPDLHPDGSDQEFIQVHEAYETLIANKGKPKPKPTNGQETWNFHDWHWKFRMSRAFDQQHHKEGTVNPYSSTERMQPAHKDQVRSQLQGLHRKARYRTSRKADSSVRASPHHQQAGEDPAQRSEDTAPNRPPAHVHQHPTATSHRSRVQPVAASLVGTQRRSRNSPAAHHELSAEHAAAARPGVCNRQDQPVSGHQTMTAAAGDAVSKAELPGSFTDTSCIMTTATDDRAEEASAADQQPAALSDLDHVTGQFFSEKETHLPPANAGSDSQQSSTTSHPTDCNSHVVAADESTQPLPSHSSSSRADNSESETRSSQGSREARGREVLASTTQRRDLASTQLLRSQSDSSQDAETGEDQNMCNGSNSASDSEDEAQIGYQGSSRVRSQLAGLRRKHRLYSS